MTDSNPSIPKSQATAPGMKTIEADLTNVLARMDSDDIVYSRKNGKNLHIRLVYPDQHDKESATYPVLVHVQGSAWFKQNLNGHVFDFKDIVTNGFILAVVEYLPIPDGQFPSQIEDTKTALRYLANHSDELRLDMNNLFLSGDSSGGHTALMSWATWNTPDLDASSQPLPEMRAIIDLYGVTDLTSIAKYKSAVPHDAPTSPENLLLGDFLKLDDMDKALRASVRYYLKKDKTYPPLLIMHGNRDSVVPFEQSTELHDLCQQLGIQSEFYCVDEADHGGGPFFTREVLAIIIDFLNRHYESQQ
ncbi:alpha/beta hydrolase fold domain-containing protein [Alkalibacterium sp.]|nr:MAG: alpha/beta hydrolase [Alkalibacterium sp.]